MSESIYLSTIGLPLLTLLLIFGMRSLATVKAARVRVVDEAAYRGLAERAAKAGKDTASALATIEDGLGDVRTRLAAIERILAAVE